MNAPADPDGIANREAALSVFLVAGEPSGDALGGRLMAALRQRTGGRVRFAGVGGSAMAAQGLRSLFPPEEIALIGVVEVLPRLRRLLRRIRETAAAILADPPDAVVTIDSPAFSLRVARRVAGRGIPLVHYVAPSVWAWRPGRARKVARYLDLMLTLLPFEPPYFERHGLRSIYVGHPVAETVPSQRDGAGFRTRHGIAAETPVLLLLPGSRHGEVRRHMPIFSGALDRLRRMHPDLQAVIPTVPSVEAAVRSAAAAWPIAPVIVTGVAEKFDAFAAADAALAASGTATLELAVAGVPTVIAYETSWLNAAILRRLALVDHVGLVNIIAGREVQPELLQENCRPDLLAAAVETLLSDAAAAEAQRRSYRDVVAKLAVPVAPSERAADAVLELVKSRRGAPRSVRTAAAGPSGRSR